jgi:hypothetical protein
MLRMTLSPKMPKGKKRVDVYLPEDQEKEFKEAVFRRKGMKKGNISEAVQEAILLWIDSGQPDVTRKRRD